METQEKEPFSVCHLRLWRGCGEVVEVTICCCLFSSGEQDTKNRPLAMVLLTFFEISEWLEGFPWILVLRCVPQLSRKRPEIRILRSLEIQLIAAQGKVAWLSAVQQGFSGPLTLPPQLSSKNFCSCLSPCAIISGSTVKEKLTQCIF